MVEYGSRQSGRIISLGMGVVHRQADLVEIGQAKGEPPATTPTDFDEHQC